MDHGGGRGWVHRRRSDSRPSRRALRGRICGERGAPCVWSGHRIHCYRAVANACDGTLFCIASRLTNCLVVLNCIVPGIGTHRTSGHRGRFSQCYWPHRAAGVFDDCGLSIEQVRTRRLVHRVRRLVRRYGRDRVPHAKPTATGRRHGPFSIIHSDLDTLWKDDYLEGRWCTLDSTFPC